jgi:hypothetical protein
MSQFFNVAFRDKIQYKLVNLRINTFCGAYYTKHFRLHLKNLVIYFINVNAFSDTNGCGNDNVMKTMMMMLTMMTIRETMDQEDHTPLYPTLPPEVQRPKHHSMLSTIPVPHSIPGCQEELQTH